MTYDELIRSGVAIGLIVLASSVFAQQSPMRVEGANTVTPKAAKVLWDSGAKFVDVRTPDLWEAGRIPGAIRLELFTEFTQGAFSEAVENNEDVIIYCMGPG